MKPAIDIFDTSAAAGPFHYKSFASLIAPLSPEAFFSEYWEQKPFFIKRACVDYFAELFSLADVDRLIGSQVLHNGDIRIAKSGTILPFNAYSNNGTANRNAILQEYAGGSTIVFEHLNRHHLPLARALAQCEVELQFPVRANSYLTPAHSQGFSLHYDTHDVLVLQVCGSKTWQIYSNPLPLPHEEQSFSPALIEHASQLAEVTLEPGDVLYLPRGFIHGASANDATSLHLTLGMRSMTLRDVAVSAVKHAAMATPALRQVARFRGAEREAALRQAKQWLHEQVAQADIGALFDDVLYSFIKKRTRPMDGRLLSMHTPAHITHDTVLRVRAGCLFHLFEHAGQVALAVDGQKIIFPHGVQKAISLMQKSDCFRPADLPDIEPESQLILARRLYAEDVLEIAADAEPPAGVRTLQRAA